MKIRRVVIENYRSIERVELANLGDFVVFYGPTGAGKTNILRAISAGFGLIEGLAGDGLPSQADNPGWLSKVFTSSDLRIGAYRAAFELTVDVRGEPAAAIEGAARVVEVHLRVVVDDAGAGTLRVSAPIVSARDEGTNRELDLRGLVQRVPEAFPSDWTGMRTQEPARVEEFQRACAAAARRLLVETLGERGFHRSDDVRAFAWRPEGAAREDAKRATVTELLAAGRVEEAISKAGVSGDDRQRERFDFLRDLLTSGPLNLPDIEAVVPEGQYRLRVRSGQGGRLRSTVASSASSLGTQQIIIILANLIFGAARVYAVEEPEAHLHAPTSGRALRQALRDLVLRGEISQLFVATHSNLFDLDTKGFWSIRLEKGGTRAVYETELSRIDQDHLFEPGPAKRIMQDLLRHGDGEQVVAYGVSGEPITAAGMLEELETDSPTGVRYAQELSRAAARMFLRAKPKLGDGG